MLTQKKIYILDTNVIIYEPNIFELFEENIIVLPFTLLQEIDKFKSESSTRGYNSREFIRQLNKVFQWKQNIEFTAKDTHFKYLKNQLKDQNIIILYNTNIESLNISNDDKIIKYSLELNNILSTQIQLINEIIPNIKDYAILITKDINMRIKAQVQNIKTEDFRNKKQSLSSNNHSKYLISESSFDLLNNSTTPVNIKDIEFIEEETENIQKTFFNNKYLQLISNKKTILCRYNTNKIFKLNYPIKSKELKINPKNIHQEFLFDALFNPSIKIVFVIGLAGTGKTLLSIQAGIAQLSKPFDKLIVARPLVPMGKDIGALPGNVEEKIDPYMKPIYDNISFLFNKNVSDGNDPVRDLKDYELLEIEPLSFIRGRSISNAFFIIDEAQNTTPHEIKTIITRAGENTKIILTGDLEQIDAPYISANDCGLIYASESFKKINSPIAATIYLNQCERSELANEALKCMI